MQDPIKLISWKISNSKMTQRNVDIDDDVLAFAKRINELPEEIQKQLIDELDRLLDEA
jgi:Arc/MetJ family transcription regulator